MKLQSNNELNRSEVLIQSRTEEKWIFNSIKNLSEVKLQFNQKLERSKDSIQSKCNRNQSLVFFIKYCFSLNKKNEKFNVIPSLPPLHNSTLKPLSPLHLQPYVLDNIYIQCYSQTVYNEWKLTRLWIFIDIYIYII